MLTEVILCDLVIKVFKREAFWQTLVAHVHEALVELTEDAENSDHSKNWTSPNSEVLAQDHKSSWPK